jgi:hypothetical protein
MGLFDQFFGSSSDQHHFGPQEGFAGVLLGASACDGHIADEEVNTLITTLARMKMYQNMTGQKFRAMMDRLLGILKRNGADGLLDKAAPSVPPELRETAFACACDIVLADGVVEENEKEFVNTLVQKLEIGGDRASTIVDVMVVKNRG